MKLAKTSLQQHCVEKIDLLLDHPLNPFQVSCFLNLQAKHSVKAKPSHPSSSHSKLTVSSHCQVNSKLKSQARSTARGHCQNPGVQQTAPTELKFSCEQLIGVLKPSQFPKQWNPPRFWHGPSHKSQLTANSAWPTLLHHSGQISFRLSVSAHPCICVHICINIYIYTFCSLNVCACARVPTHPEGSSLANPFFNSACKWNQWWGQVYKENRVCTRPSLRRTERNPTTQSRLEGNTNKQKGPAPVCLCVCMYVYTYPTLEPYICVCASPCTFLKQINTCNILWQGA